MRVLIGHACRALGDDEAAELEHRGGEVRLRTTRGTAGSGASGCADHARAPQSRNPLTARELHVLRLISTGRTNKEIAEELCLSERTIDRHVSNILTKLDVRSRTAATAYAYDHKLF